MKSAILRCGRLATAVLVGATVLSCSDDGNREDDAGESMEVRAASQEEEVVAFPAAWEDSRPVTPGDADERWVRAGARASVESEGQGASEFLMVTLDLGSDRDLHTWRSDAWESGPDGVINEQAQIVALLPDEPPLAWVTYGRLCGQPCTYSYGMLLRPLADGLEPVWEREIGYWFGDDDGEDPAVDFREGWIRLTYADRVVTSSWSERDGRFLDVDAPTADGGVTGESGVESPEGDHAALVQAAQAGDVERARAYLEAGADPDTPVATWGEGINPRTLLMDVAGQGDVEMVRLLLAYGADADASVFMDNYAQAPVIEALGWPEVLEVLLEAGANPNIAMDISGRTPLMAAAEEGDLEVMRLLVEHSADVNAVGSTDDEMATWYFTALSLTAEVGDAAAVEFLLDAGADPSAGVGADGEFTALELAQAAGHSRVVALLGRRSGGVQPVGGRAHD